MYINKFDFIIILISCIISIIFFKHITITILHIKTISLNTYFEYIYFLFFKRKKLLCAYFKCHNMASKDKCTSRMNHF